MKIASAAAMKEMDRFAIEEMGVPSLRLMENAAHAVAKQFASWPTMGGKRCHLFRRRKPMAATAWHVRAS